MKSLPGRAIAAPLLASTFLLSSRIIWHVAQLHVNLLVRLQEYADWNGENDVVEREYHNQAPNLIDSLADREVARRVSYAQGIANVGYESFVHWAVLLDIGAADKEQDEVHTDEVGT